jgi:rare lipoprotein A
MRFVIIALGILTFLLTCQIASRADDTITRPQTDFVSKTGLASWYSRESPGIRETTANMEIFDDALLTCAIWDVPFNSVIEVRNLENNKSVFVRVNDRGPAKRLVAEGRIIDLTRAAFRRIADTRRGLVRVEITLLEYLPS